MREGRIGEQEDREVWRGREAFFLFYKCGVTTESISKFLVWAMQGAHCPVAHEIPGGALKSSALGLRKKWGTLGRLEAETTGIAQNSSKKSHQRPTLPRPGAGGSQGVGECCFSLTAPAHRAPPPAVGIPSASLSTP